jgi:hypothetical protein
MTQAITDDLVIAVRIASFLPLSGAVTQDIAADVSRTMVELGRKHNFLIYKTTVETRKENK